MREGVNRSDIWRVCLSTNTFVVYDRSARSAKGNRLTRAMPVHNMKKLKGLNSLHCLLHWQETGSAHKCPDSRGLRIVSARSVLSFVPACFFTSSLL